MFTCYLMLVWASLSEVNIARPLKRKIRFGSRFTVNDSGQKIAMIKKEIVYNEPITVQLQ